MRIVHISTSDQGGAGIAAHRLHEGLLQQGVDSHFLCLEKNFEYENKVKFENIYEDLTVLEKVARKIYRHKWQFQKSQNNELLAYGELCYEQFSFPFSMNNVHLHPLLQSADIIHLHWVSGFLDFKSFFENIKKKIVISLQDLNYVMGGFHYTFDLENNYKILSLEKKLLDYKTNCYNSSTISYVVGNSNWTTNFAKKTNVFKNVEFKTINNLVDVHKIFRIEPPLKKSLLGINDEDFVILVGAHNFDVKRKGFLILDKALEMLPFSFTVIQFGSHALFSKSNYKIVSLGHLKNQNLLNIIYNLAEVFVLPSLEEAFGNVMIEALAAGIPVVSFKTGGASDIIKEEENGFLADDYTSISLSRALTKAYEQKNAFGRKNIINYAITNYSIEAITQKWLSDVYLKLI